MENLSVVSEFDSLVNLLHQTSTGDANLQRLLLVGLHAKESLDQKQKDIKSEMERIEKELAASTRTKQIRAEQVREAETSVRVERMRRKVALRAQQRAKEDLDSVLDTLPENMKREILAKTAVKYESSSQSDIDITDSNLSSFMQSESNSSDDQYSHLDSQGRNQRFFSRRSTLMQVTGTGGSQLAHQHQLAFTMNDLSLLNPSDDQVSSSTDSGRSSVQLFHMIFDKIKSRQHELKSRYFVVGDRCNVCNLRIGCGKKGFTCLDCRANVHSLCHQELAVPCIPTNTHKNERFDVGDYCCPTFKPQIPALVIHCINQIEDRGLDQVGLYRMPAYGRTLREVKEFSEKNEGVPNLTKLKVNVICALLKDFFASLKLALIPQKLFKNMVQCFFGRHSTAGNAFSDVYNTFISLPVPIRDTLIFLILHLQNVAASPACRMSPKSLSKVFTPLLVENYENGSTYEVEKKNCSLLEHFIQMPSDYWKAMLIKDL